MNFCTSDWFYWFFFYPFTKSHLHCLIKEVQAQAHDNYDLFTYFFFYFEGKDKLYRYLNQITISLYFFTLDRVYNGLLLLSSMFWSRRSWFFLQVYLVENWYEWDICLVLNFFFALKDLSKLEQSQSEIWSNWASLFQ